MQMFIAGLHEPIRKEIMKTAYASFQAVYEAALDLEVIQQDNRAAKPVTIAAVEEETPTNISDYQDDKVEAINTVWFMARKPEDTPAATSASKVSKGM
jgi:hypothetical protein